MPHFSFPGHEKRHAKKNSELGEESSDKSGTSETSVSDSSRTSKGWKDELSGDQDDKTPKSHKISQLHDDDTTIDSAVDNNFRLLKTGSSERGLWQQAWDKVPSELTKVLPPDFEPVGTTDTQSEVQKVHDLAQERAEDAKEEERKIPHTNKTYRQIWGKVASAANKFQIVGDLVAQGEPVYAALPWSLIKFAIQCAVGEDEAYHTMLSGSELVSDLVSQYSALEQLYARIDSELSNKFRKALVSFYKSILQFQLTAIHYFDPHCKARRLAKGLNPVTATGIKQIRQSTDEIKQQVDEDAALVSFEVAKLGIDNLRAGQQGQDQQLEAIKDGIKTLAGHTGQAFRNLSQQQQEVQRKRNDTLLAMWKEPLDNLMTKIENQGIEKARKNLENVRKWLSVAKPREDFVAAKEKRFMTLGDWLLKDPRFENWQTHEQSDMLWLFGFAGTGKTGLVCRVINHLEVGGQKAGRVAFFFCSNDKASTTIEEAFSRSDPEEALRSVVSQVATSQAGHYVAPVLQNKYDTIGPDSDQSVNLGYSDCIDILVAVSEHIPLSIVLDAFDECDQKRSPRLVQYLQELVRRSPKNVKIFISTRPFPAVEDNLMPDRSIEVTAADNSGDVRAFIRATLKNRISDKALLNGVVSEDLKNEIEITLSNRANNMFLYASLLLNQLCDRNHNDDESSIRKKLSSLPRDLADVYNRIMNEIHDDRSNSERSCRIAQNTFKWLLYAQESLPHDALLEAISPPERKAKHEEVIRSCRTLVVRGRYSYEFVHYSVREHVGQMKEYSSSQCHIVATQSCLNILNASFGSDKSRHELSDGQKAFEQYAIIYWPLHYESIGQEDLRDQRTTINGLLRSLLLQGRSQQNKYEDWFGKVRRKERQLKDNKYLASKFNSLRASPLNPLFAACVFGLEDLIAKFGRKLNGLNKLNDDGQSALCLAIENNKLDVVKALLTRRFPADLNLLNTKAVEQLENWNDEPRNVILYASAMQCAAATGKLEIAEYLIEQGAHIDLVAGYYGSPLQAAALRGHSSMVDLLLSKGAEPNSQGGYHGNALQAAASAGHYTIITQLLESKPPALVDTPGGHYGCALRAAVYSGCGDTVWTLLEEKADPNMKIKGCRSLLEEAVSMGRSHKEIVRDLIGAEAKADVSPKGNKVHIMHQAVMFGMIELVEYCLKRKCKIDMVTTEGPKYHRKFGDFPDEMTPLGYACAEGHADIVELLLDHGAPFEENKRHSAVLWTAAYQGHAEVVDLLLQRFRKTHSSEETARFLSQRPHPKAGHPILFAAASSGKADVVKVLIDHSVKYDSNWYNATPLLASATFGSPEVTKLLLDYHSNGQIDAHINQQAGNGRTALYEACSLGQPAIAKLLLQAGADYRIPEKDNTTPLQVSCCKGRFRIVPAIMERASKDLEHTEFLNYMNTQHRPTGKTALIDCSERNYLSFLNLMLDHGADYTIADKGGYTTLHAASRHDNSSIMAAIVAKAAQDLNQEKFLDFLNTRHESGNIALGDCASRNRLEAVNILLAAGADHRPASYDKGNTPLHWACIGGHDRVVSTILSHAKAKESDPSLFLEYINQVNKPGNTPLMEACVKNHLPTIKILLNHGAHYTMARIKTGGLGVTALHVACWNGSREAITYLLERSSQELEERRFVDFINGRNGKGKTPLHDAAETGRHAIVKLLLEKYNVDHSTASQDKITPLFAAASNGHVAVVETLLKAGAKSQDRNSLISHIDHKNKQSVTALMEAASKGHPNIVRHLLDHGATYHHLDASNFNALHYCAFRNKTNCVRLLLEHASKDQDKARFNAFLNQQGSSNHASPLRDAAVGGPSHTEVAKLILSYKPVYDGVDSGKRTPLHHAVGTRNAELAKALLEYASQDPDRERFKRFVNAREINNDNAWEGSNRSGQREIVDALKATEVVQV